MEIKTKIKEKKLHNKEIKEGIIEFIVDSNVTTVIAALVLYFMGTGPVKGFAVTLMIGIVLSMFTAIFITRKLTEWAINMGMLSKPWHFKVKRG